MSDQSAQEPTMEEILASIRRIISEDDAPAETPAAAAAPTAEPEPAPEPEPEPAAAETIFEAPPEPEAEPEAVEEDVLELTELYEAPAEDAPSSETIGDLDIVETAPEPEPEPEPIEAAALAPEPAYDSLVGESAAASAASAFAGLAASFKKPEASQAASGDMPFVSGNTVEAMVAEMLRPLLKDWLDNNLPGIVQAAVQKEVERIARSA
jgi:cell pole-organizing protein PopZ